MAYDGKIALFGESDLGVNGGGVVFRMTAGPKGSWRWSSLYQFGGNDGPPMSSVVLDSTGRICGTALGGENSAGLVFRMAPWRGSETVWTFSALYDFKGVPDGRYPAAPLVLDSAGHIYGTTEGGGDSGNGTVFEVWK
jgi:hypothetical protein